MTLKKIKFYIGTKTTYEKKQVTKISYLLIQKILYFIRISVKCILRQIFNEIEEYQVYIGTKTTYEIFLKQKNNIF